MENSSELANISWIGYNIEAVKIQKHTGASGKEMSAFIEGGL